MICLLVLFVHPGILKRGAGSRRGIHTAGRASRLLIALVTKVPPGILKQGIWENQLRTNGLSRGARLIRHQR